LGPVVDLSTGSASPTAGWYGHAVDVSGDIAAYLNDMIYEGEIASATGSFALTLDAVIVSPNMTATGFPPAVVLAEIDHDASWTNVNQAQTASVFDLISTGSSGKAHIVKQTRVAGKPIMNSEWDGTNRRWHFQWNIKIGISPVQSNEHKTTDEALSRRFIVVFVLPNASSHDLRWTAIKTLNPKIRRITKNDIL